tara:strand:- start:92 stop:505 length:414 start_codon:yes stop_codon:yes gene_type:complete
MARRKGSELSVAQLETLLAQQKGRVSALSSKRDRLQKELASIDVELKTLQGATTSDARRGRRRGKRPKNTQSLTAVVAGILGDNTKGLGLDDLVTKVVESGYKTKAKNFKNVVYQCVYNSPAVYRDKQSGTFRLKKS